MCARSHIWTCAPLLSVGREALCGRVHAIICGRTLQAIVALVPASTPHSHHRRATNTPHAGATPTDKSPRERHSLQMGHDVDGSKHCPSAGLEP